MTKSHASKATPQFGFGRGIMEFGKLDWESTKNEREENLLGMDTVCMVKRPDLKQDLVLNVLSYLMFLKRKRTGMIKARGCADGRPQRKFIGKEESSVPTVSIYALMACCRISTIE